MQLAGVKYRLPAVIAMTLLGATVMVRASPIIGQVDDFQEQYYRDLEQRR